MTDEESIAIALEILLKNVQPGTAVNPGDVARVRRAFESSGAVCHSAPFGLFCTASRAQLARLFGAASASVGPGDSLPVPAGLADVVERITIPRKPEFFP